MHFTKIQDVSNQLSKHCNHEDMLKDCAIHRQCCHKFHNSSKGIAQQESVVYLGDIYHVKLVMHCRSCIAWTDTIKIVSHITSLQITMIRYYIAFVGLVQIVDAWPNLQKFCKTDLHHPVSFSISSLVLEKFFSFKITSLKFNSDICVFWHQPSTNLRIPAPAPVSFIR